MKTGKKLLAILLAVLTVLSLAGCGGSGKGSSASSAPMATNASYDYRADYSYEEAAETEEPVPAPAADAAAAGLGGAAGELPSADAMSEKIIYNAEVTLEAVEFDAALEKLSAMVKDLGGYMESTSISGNNYSAISRGYAGARSAYYTIRVPSANFNALTGGLGELGNVPYSRTYTRNITTDYYDVQSRLDAYKVQEKRLLEMLSIAESVDDMLAIQRELTNVQYEIDSLTGTLRYYDNRVGYSTVNLTVNEVRQYTPEPTITLTYWERMSKGFRESVKKTADFFKEFFLWFVTSLPWMIPLALVLWAVIALLRRRASKNPEIAARRQARREARAARKAQRKARRSEPSGGNSAAE